MKKIIKLSRLLMIVCLLLTGNHFAQTSVNGKDIVGVWKTIDDETGRSKSHVQVYKKGDKYHAKIVKLLDPQTLKENNAQRFEDLKCTKCPRDHGKNEPTIGLEIIWDMEKQKEKYAKGSIMDPNKGKVYTCTLWMDSTDKTGNTIKVRGWIAMFYRTQTWYRIK